MALWRIRAILAEVLTYRESHIRLRAKTKKLKCCLRRVGPRLLALLVCENATKELANRGFGQLLAAFDGFGGFVGGEALLAEVQYVLLRHRGAGPLHDEGLDRLTA